MIINSLILLLIFCLTLIHKQNPSAKKLTYFYPNYGDIPLLNRKVIGGRRVNIAEHPYIVSIHWQMAYIVPGTILCESLVITTAWYLQNIPIHQIDVIGGETFMNREIDKKTVLFLVIHEKFNPNTMENDLALLRLHKPFVYHYNLKPIGLYSSHHIKDKLALVSGWGRCDTTVSKFCLHRTNSIFYGELSDITLKTVSFTVTSPRRCMNYVKRRGVQLYPGMICLGHNRFKSILNPIRCLGVPGAPLVIDGQLAGLLSWGLGCGYKKDLPLIYTDVRNYALWIYDQFKVLYNEIPENFVKEMDLAAVAYRQYEAMTLSRPIFIKEPAVQQQIIAHPIDSVLCLLSSTVYDIRDYIRNSSYRQSKQQLYSILRKEMLENRLD